MLGCCSGRQQTGCRGLLCLASDRLLLYMCVFLSGVCMVAVWLMLGVCFVAFHKAGVHAQTVYNSNTQSRLVPGGGSFLAACA
jgi:hypothetical protein